MPGSAILDPDVLVDDLFLTLIDEIRDELHTEFGVRAYRVFTVLRTWTGAHVGEGDFADVEIEITPQPLVLPFLGDYRYKMELCGLDEAGTIALREISLTYTKAELVGSETPEANEEFFYIVREAHGQLQDDTKWLVQGPPYPERAISEEGPGWMMVLRRSSP